jgi:CRP-like cAMP-binding protein
VSQPHSANWLLGSLSHDDLAALAADLEPVDLPLRMKLHGANKRIEHVYFLAKGVASTVSRIGHEAPIEIGMTGCEGLVGISLLLGSDRTPNESMIQIAGTGWTISTAKFEVTLERRAALATLFRKYAHTFLMQSSSTAHANGRATLDERLARWLLMADDRWAGTDLPLTHDFLAIMLGVRRAGVTFALQEFERRALISRRRGLIQLIDRAEIEALADGFYGSAEAEYQRVIGRPLRRT